MNIKYCSVTGCCNSTMIGRKKKLFFEIPKTEPLRRIWAKSDREHNGTKSRYFCEDHFDPDDIQSDGNLKIFAAPVCNIPDVKSNHLVYSNRRKSERQQQQISTMRKRMKFVVCKSPPPYTLSMVDGYVDNTVLNLEFHDFDEEESTDRNVNEVNDINLSEYCTNNDEDNDCIITNDILPTIIDLSLDDTKNYLEESSNMIEVIMCNDIEPDEYREKVNDTETCNASSIDLTIEEGSAIIEILDRDELISHIPTIDLTDELWSDEDETIFKGNEDASTSIIEKIKQNLVGKHLKSLKSIQENRENGVLEIEISKDASFKSDEDFQQHLMKVVKLVQKSKREGEMESESMECEENIATEVNPPVEQCAFSIRKVKIAPLKRFQPHFNREGQNKHLPIKTYVPAQEASVRKDPSVTLPAICIESENSHDNFNVQATRDSSNKSSLQFLAKIRKYNTNQMLKRTNSYMGVSTESLQLIKNMLSVDFNIKYALILLLRKIKLNESFSTLSDILCWNRNYCRELYETLLPKLSNTLSCFIQWPTNCRESRGIADIFEIEIEKPKFFVEQNLSFCKERNRHFVKILICTTTTGYITYVSVPFYTIQPDTLDLCSTLILKNCYNLVVNPILMDCRSSENKSTRIVPLDFNHNADRQVIEIVFQRLRRFMSIGGIVDTKYIKFVQHKVTVVASLCNLNHK